MRSVETTAKTRQDAIKMALDKLGAELHEVQIEILDEGSRGLFGFGARDVKVKLTLEKDVPTRRRDDDQEQEERDRGRGRQRGGRDRGGRRGGAERPAEKEAKEPDRQVSRPKTERGRRPERKKTEKPGERQGAERPQRQAKRQESPEPRHAEKDETPKTAPAREQERDMTPVSDVRRLEATALLGELVEKMGIEATAASNLTEDGRARINLESEDSAILIGRKGRNLEAMQYLLNRMMRPGEGETSERFVVDVESYLDRRRETLEDMARHFAEKAKETGRDVRVKPLSPQERRIIHLTLQDDADVRTFSLGSSSVRTVVISPKNASRSGRDGAGRSRRSRGGRRGNGRGESQEPDVESAAVTAEDEQRSGDDEETRDGNSQES